MKGIYGILTIKGQRLTTFAIRSEMRQACFPAPLLPNAIRQSNTRQIDKKEGSKALFIHR